MRYCVNNQLNLFQFHDAELSFISLDESRLVVSAKHLNIDKNADVNPHDYDMEIELAKISFYEFEILTFEPMRAYKIDEDGNWYTDEPQIIFKDKDAEQHFIDEVKRGITINCIDIREENNKTLLEISTCAKKCFFATFAVDGNSVEWDKYLKKAWYELHKQYKYKTTLITPTGEFETDIHIICHEEDMYYQGELEKAPVVDVGIEYDGKNIWGHGHDYLWVDAFADLQKQLPEDVILKICLTCRHGNMCPYGNKPGEVFCTKDLLINSKEDMCNLFDNSKEYEIENRSKNYTDNCSYYQPQSWNDFTYNDYLYWIDK